jgi:hypothetical protein
MGKFYLRPPFATLRVESYASSNRPNHTLDGRQNFVDQHTHRIHPCIVRQPLMPHRQ